MDPESLPKDTKPAPKKRVFLPKPPPRRVIKPIAPKVEKIEASEDDDAKRQELLRRFTEDSARVKRDVKKVAHTEVVFGHRGSSTHVQSLGPRKGGASSSRIGGPGASGLKREKEYNEPWDYYRNYPTTLPLRRPYSGNPEVLDDEEFGEASENAGYDKQGTDAAVSLGLMDEELEPRLIFLQLPEVLPMVKQSSNAEDKGVSNIPNPTKESRSPKKLFSLDELPAGHMGKMLVYRSGAIKLKLGDTLYDVSRGLDCVFAQDVVAINTEQKHCCIVGELGKRAIITPDVDSLFNRGVKQLFTQSQF